MSTTCEDHHWHGAILPCPACSYLEHQKSKPPDPMAIDPYAMLKDVLARAAEQAAEGKGKERHANGEPFEDQKICGLARYLGSIDGPVFQACKKAIEAKRLPKDAAVAELLGAIVYLAAAVIVREEQP